MSARKSRTQQEETAPVLRDEKDGAFYPLEILWTSDLPSGRFLSEGAARWFLRNYGPALVEARAIRFDCGRWLVNPERVAQVRSQVSEARALARFAAKPA